MDNQLEMGWAAADYGPWAIPHWDPAPDYGQPLFANPEGFISHPGFTVGVSLSGSPVHGLRVLYAVQVCVLLLGAAWLGVELGIPWWLGMLCGVPLLVSEEWHQRVATGHFMAIGITAWPALFAGTLRSLGGPAGLPGVLAAAVGGSALGLAFLGGAHYPTVLGIFLVLCIVWLRVAGPWLGLGLVAVCALPIAMGANAAAPRYLGPLVFAAIGLAGLIRGRAHLRVAASTLAAVALGVVAGAGVKLPASALVMVWSARTRSPWELEPTPVDLEGFWAMASRNPSVEQPLWFWSEWTLPLLFVGLVLLAVHHLIDRRAEGAPEPRGWWLALAAAMALAVAYGSGRPLSPWLVIAFSPAMAGIDFPIRLQWVLLFVPWFGLCAAGLSVARRLGGDRAALGAALLAAAWLATDLEDAQLPILYEPGTPPARSVDIRGISDDSDIAHGKLDEILVSASGRGLIRRAVATGIRFGPLDNPLGPGPALARQVAPPGPPPAVSGRTNHWTVTGPPGALVEVAQRDIGGWRCGSTRAPEDMAWLTLTLGPDGRADCVYRTPGLVVGALAQALALGAMAFLVRRRRGG